MNGYHAANRHRRRLPAQGPGGTQWRKQQQVGLVLHQRDTAARQVFQPSANGPFFSPRLGPSARRNAFASRRNPVRAIGGECCRGKASGHPRRPIVAATAGPSNARRGSPIAWALRSAAFATTPATRASNCSADPSGPHPRVPADHRLRHRPRPNCKSFAGLPPKRWRPPPLAFLDQVLRWRGSGDTAKHPAHASIAVAVGNGTRGSGQCPSWLASTQRLLMDGPFVKKLLRTHLVSARVACRFFARTTRRRSFQSLNTGNLGLVPAQATRPLALSGGRLDFR